jgi:hypothetical protein
VLLWSCPVRIVTIGLTCLIFLMIYLYKIQINKLHAHACMFGA